MRRETKRLTMTAATNAAKPEIKRAWSRTISNVSCCDGVTVARMSGVGKSDVEDMAAVPRNGLRAKNWAVGRRVTTPMAITTTCDMNSFHRNCRSQSMHHSFTAYPRLPGAVRDQL